MDEPITKKTISDIASETFKEMIVKDMMLEEDNMKSAAINFSQMTADLGSLSYALRNAVEMGFMAREHAGLIWKKWLDLSGLNVPKAKKKGGDLDNAT